MARPRLPETVAGLHHCTVCKKTKPVSDFYRDASKCDGYGHRCKDCNRTYKRAYHKDYFSREETKRKRRARYSMHKGEEAAAHRIRYKLNGAKWNANRRAKNIIDPIPNLLSIAKSRAKRKGLPFDLTAADISIPEYCPALGIKLIVGEKKSIRNSPSLDRKDNKKGYVKGNVIVVSLKANTIKNDATPAELRRIAEFYEGLE